MRRWKCCQSTFLMYSLMIIGVNTTEEFAGVLCIKIHSWLIMTWWIKILADPNCILRDISSGRICCALACVFSSAYSEPRRSVSWKATLAREFPFNAATQPYPRIDTRPFRLHTNRSINLFFLTNAINLQRYHRKGNGTSQRTPMGARLKGLLVLLQRAATRWQH